MQSPDELLNFGFILLDKPRGPSSHEVTSYVKKLLGAKRCGHAGTLDPRVSGVMIIGINQAAKLLRFITSTKKSYVGVMKLYNPPKDIKTIQMEMDKFCGRIRQMPPKESAVAKRMRTRSVFSFKALELDGRKVLFCADVEAGTYIRTLCIQVGKKFGGGQMAELRRTAVGNISEKDLCTLPQLVDALHLYQKGENSSQMKSLIKPAEEILSLASLRLSNESEDTVCRGAPLAMSGVASVEASFAKGEYVELLSQKGKLLCIANAVVDSEELSSSIDKSKIVAYPKIVLEKRLGKKEKEKNKQKEKTKL